jgi:putative transposase
MMALAITPDHVNLFVKAHPFSCPSWIASQFKGFTTWRPQVAFAHLRSSLPALWSRSYLAAVGAVSAQTVLWFIDTQNG